MQRTNKYLHPHRITGRRNIHPPYTSIFPRASIPLLSKHLQFPYYFPRRVSCFVTCRQTEILPPLSPPINRQFDHRHRIGKRLPNAWKRTHAHTRSTRVQSRVLEFFRSFEENYTGDLSRMYRRGINIEQVVPWGGKEMASRPFSSHCRIGSNRWR